MRSAGVSEEVVGLHLRFAEVANPRALSRTEAVKLAAGYRAFSPSEVEAMDWAWVLTSTQDLEFSASRRRSESRHSQGLSNRTVALIMLALVAFIVWIGSLMFDSGDSGDTDGLDPSTQDPTCHRYALAWASSRNLSFEWNGVGMESYLSAYEDCLDNG
jgi:hypothetical protein